MADADLTGQATFAYCRLGSEFQKYTTVFYTPEAASVLNELSGPDFQCNHERGTHTKRAAGRGPDGAFVSSEAAAYPDKFNNFLSRAFTVARTGGAVVPKLMSKTADPLSRDSLRDRRVEMGVDDSPAAEGSLGHFAPGTFASGGATPAPVQRATAASARATAVPSTIREEPSPVAFRGFPQAAAQPPAVPQAPELPPPADDKKLVKLRNASG